MRKILEILTPENVYVEFELAGLGSRFLALLIDNILRGIIIFIVFIGMVMGGIDFSNIFNSNTIVIAVWILITFTIYFGYFIFFEMIMNGQTPGKKAIKLKVIMQNGEPIGFFESFLRNILRIADFLPFLFLLGSAFIVFTENYKRIGDFAANTIVVKVRKEEKLITLNSLLEKANSEGEIEQSVNIYPVNNFEYSVIKEFMARKDKLGERKVVFEYHLNNYLLRKFKIEQPFNNVYEFFNEILRMNSGI